MKIYEFSPLNQGPQLGVNIIQKRMNEIEQIYTYSPPIYQKVS